MKSPTPLQGLCLLLAAAVFLLSAVLYSPLALGDEDGDGERGRGVGRAHRATLSHLAALRKIRSQIPGEAGAPLDSAIAESEADLAALKDASVKGGKGIDPAIANSALASVEEHTGKHTEVLEGLLLKVPDSARPGILRAIRVSKRGRKAALEALSGMRGKDGPHGPPPGARGGPPGMRGPPPGHGGEGDSDHFVGKGPPPHVRDRDKPGPPGHGRGKRRKR